MSLALTRSSAPSREPLDLERLKQQVRILQDAEDGLLREYIKAARARVEHYTGRALTTQTWVAKFDDFSDPDICEGGVLVVPRPPLQSVTSIQYVDTNGDTQTLSSSVYTVDASSVPGRVYLAPEQTWPGLYNQRHAVTMTYVAGYGDSGDDVEPDIVQAVRLLTAHYYQFREPFVAGTIITPVPEGIRSLLDYFRIWEPT